MDALCFPVRATPHSLLRSTRHDICGIRLRHAVDSDLGWMRALYAETREAELRAIPWPVDAMRVFLDDQFSLQHRHFAAQFAASDFCVVERDNQPIGRYYVSRDDPMCIVDVCLVARARGAGIGTALIAETLDHAQRINRFVVLHVLRDNVRAAKLYRQLGFAVTADTGAHLEMRWSPSALS